MKIHEYQAKALLSQYGIPVPAGDVASTPAEAKKIAAGLEGKVAVKAQVYAGGRGKAGGIKLAANPDEAEKSASGIIGQKIGYTSNVRQRGACWQSPGRKGCGGPA